jgi:hypothetical protein
MERASWLWRTRCALVINATTTFNTVASLDKLGDGIACRSLSA